MARTKTPTPEQAPTTPAPDPEPATQEQPRPSPVLAWPAEWPVPELPAETEKRRRTRGLPMAPVLASAGNGTTLVATAAYSAGGPMAAAATGVVVAAGATAAVLRRRAAVRRSVASRAGSATAGGRRGGGSGWRSGAGSGSTGGATRAGSGLRRSGSGGRSGAGSGLRNGTARSGSGPSTGGSRGGTGSGKHSPRSGLLRKNHGRHSLDNTKPSARRKKKDAAATEKAAKKALKRAAKDLAAKTSSSGSGKGHALKAAAGRAVRAAWNTSRPHAARATKAASRHLKHSGGALLDGVRAAGAAAWTWLRHRDAGAALDRLKAVWRRRRKQRAQKKNPDTPTIPPVAETVRRPADTTLPNTFGGTRMSGGGHHFVAPAMELARAAAHYQPQGMLQVGADFAGLEEALRLHAEAMKITVENADATQPLAPQIIELMRQIHGLQLKAAELAAELQPAFRQLHDVDISRLENPRKGVAGERMWDVSTNI